METDLTAGKIRVMQAYVDGKEIQARERTLSPPDWVDFRRDDAPCWNWFASDYRVKPEPREWWTVDVYSAPLFKSVGEAERYKEHINHVCGIEVVHVREVLED